MDINESIENNEILDENENVAETENSLMTAVIIGAVGLVGILTYKFAVKPIIAKLKAKKKNSEPDVIETDFVEKECEDESEEVEEENEE